MYVCINAHLLKFVREFDYIHSRVFPKQIEDAVEKSKCFLCA